MADSATELALLFVSALLLDSQDAGKIVPFTCAGLTVELLAFAYLTLSSQMSAGAAYIHFPINIALLAWGAAVIKTNGISLRPTVTKTRFTGHLQLWTLKPFRRHLVCFVSDRPSI